MASRMPRTTASSLVEADPAVVASAVAHLLAGLGLVVVELSSTTFAPKLSRLQRQKVHRVADLEFLLADPEGSSG